MEINFPESFPDVSEEDLLKPISEFEKERGINGYIFDRKNIYPTFFKRETREQYAKKKSAMHKKFIKMFG